MVKKQYKDPGARCQVPGSNLLSSTYLIIPVFENDIFLM